MATYMLKRDIENEPIILMRLSGVQMERLDPEGWVPSNNIEWTGIGGAADWDAVSSEEAAQAAVSLGRTREDVLG